MVAKPDSLKHRNTYIPSSVQKSMAQHIERTMPDHLKKFQQGGYIPKHAEKSMSQHMQKNLPGHLKKYADPYIQQKVMWGNNATSSASPTTLRGSSPYRPSVARSKNMFEKQIFSSDSQQMAADSPASSGNLRGGQIPEQQDGGNNYDFIMNSQNQNKSPLFAPENTKMRIAIFAVGVILLIIIMSVIFSFLNSAGNKQKENLMSVAQTQQEVTRVLDLSKENITDAKLKDKTVTLRAVMISSQQDIVAALVARGSKANPKDLAQGQNPQIDTDLESALAQARYDEALNEILLSLMDQYMARLQAVFDNGNASEKELATEAFNQVNLIFDFGGATEAEEAQQEAASSQ